MPTTIAPRLLRMVGFAAAFVLAGYLGRLTAVDGATISLVWPAAGVSFLWFVHEDVRWRSPDVLALAAVAFVVNTTTGASPAMGVVLVLVNVSQALLVTALCRRWIPTIFAGERPLRPSRDLIGLVLAAAVGCAVGTAIGVAGVWSTSGSFSLGGTAVWWGRNAVGVVGVGAAGLLVLHRLTNPGPRGLRHARGWWVELAALGAVTLALFAIEAREELLPVSFLLPAVLVWAGMRFSPTVAAVHGLLAGTGFVVVALSGNGPFFEVATREYAALMSQLFVAISVIVGMVLAIYREQTAELLSELGAARHESERQADVLRTVIRSMDEGVIVLDTDLRVRMSNPAASQIAGSPLVCGRSLPSQLDFRNADGTRMPDERRPSARALAGEVVTDLDIILDSAAGSRVLQVSASPLGRPPTGVVVAIRDVTDERARQRDLAAFAGVVAHDLMNPLGTVDGWAEQLEEAVEQAIARGEYDGRLELGMLRRIRGASARMRALVRDLLAHATSGDRALELTVVDLESLVRDIAVERAAVGHVHVGALPEVCVDSGLVRQLLDNLVGNAIKYVAPDEVPDVEVAGVPTYDGRVRVTIADRGIGIPDGQHELVFADFQRAHPDYPGTGLGLAICRRIVDRHAGSITARPRPGGGTLVELTLPAADARADVPAGVLARG